MFSQHLLFGRAILVCEELYLLTADPQLFATSQRGAASAPEESYKLFVPTICDEDYHKRLEKDEKISGVIIIEGLMRGALCNIQAFPCGILMFRCVNAIRNNILLSAEFSNKDIVDGNVQICWMSSHDVLTIHNKLILDPTAPCHTWEMLWTVAKDKINTWKTNNDIVPYPCESFNFQHWSVQNVFNSWSKAVGHWNTDDNQTQPPRAMTPLEHMWLYFHVVLRWRKDLNVDPLSMSNLLRNIVVSGNYDMSDFLLSNEIGAEMKVKQEYHGMMATLTGTCPGLMKELSMGYSDLCVKLTEGRRMVKNILTKEMQNTRIRFKAFPLFTSCKLKTFTEDSIETVPLSVLDLDSIKAWSKERRKVLLETDMNPDKVFRSIYERAKPVYIGNENTFLRLYGNINSLLALMQQTDKEVTTLTYRVERLGSLSTSTVDLLPLYGMSNSCRSRSPFHLGTSSMTSIRLAESGEHCTPIWATPTKTGMNYMRIVPFLGRKRKQTYEIDYLENLIEKYMYNPDQPKPTMTNEYLQSGLHWSSFVADIDLRFSGTRPDVKSVARDAVIMFDSIFETIFEPQKIERHLVFASVDDGRNNKLGIHHHAILPKGMVFTSSACRDMAQILEAVRHLFPETIGMGEDSPTYDMAIYPVPSLSNPHKGHCLRGPLQVKFDGKHCLKCVLDTKHSPLTVRDMMIHGPQLDICSGEKVLFGRVVNGINGVQDPSDVPFFRKYETNIMNKNINSVCSRSTTDIMAEINKRTVLFAEGENNVSLLLEIINDLWIKCDGKLRMIEHMKSAEGRGGKRFDNMQTTLMIRCSKFVHDHTKNTINLVVDDNPKKTMPFCPRRPHNTPAKGDVVVTVGYSSKMIRFMLFVSMCFKMSCNISSKRYFLPNVMLSMPNIFVTPSIQLKVERFLQEKFQGPSVRVTNVTIQDADDEDDGVETEDVIHDRAGAYMYIQEKNITHSIRQLFMFLPNRVLAMCLSSNIYMVCLIRKKETVLQSLVYVSSVMDLIVRHLAEKNILNGTLLRQLREVTKKE